MAANDDNPAELGSAVEAAAPWAAVIRLDDIATETLVLFLEIVGWSVVTVDAIEALPYRAYQLVFVEESLFTDGSIGAAPGYADWQNVVVVGSQQSKPINGLEDTKVHHASLPLDVARLEALVAKVS